MSYLPIPGDPAFKILAERSNVMTGRELLDALREDARVWVGIDFAYKLAEHQQGFYKDLAPRRIFSGARGYLD